MLIVLLCSCSDFFLSELDECGVIDGDNSSCSDCAGVPNGSSWESDCGCVPADNLGNDCDDCADVPNGISTIDECNVCNNYIATEGLQPEFPYGACDCNGDSNGTAYTDGCEECVGGLTGNIECPIDCEGILNGDSVEDNCGTCDNDSSNDCLQDCAGIWGGSLIDDECDVCGGDNSSCTGCMINGADNYSPDNIIPDNESCVIDYSTVQLILNSHCTVCHGPAGGINLESYSNVIGSNIIEVGDSTNSLLWQVIGGPSPTMPEDQIGTLSNDNIHKIALWIQIGAEN